MKLEEGSHCRYQIRYHMVWKVKYSRQILIGERPKFLKQLIYDIGERYEYKVEAVGVDGNHLHVFAGAHPAISPAQMIQVIKSITARGLYREYPEIKKFLWGGAVWAIGYYVRTISDGPIDKVVKKYVEDQSKESSGNKSRRRCHQLRLI